MSNKTISCLSGISSEFEKESNCEFIKVNEKVDLNGICLDKDKAIKQIISNQYLDDLTVDFFIELAKEICVERSQKVIDLEDDKYIDTTTETEFLCIEREAETSENERRKSTRSFRNRCIKSDDRKISYCILTSLFNTILGGCREVLDDYICVRRWLKKLDKPLLLYDVIVIPMYSSHSSHWWLIIICYPWRLFELRNSCIQLRFNSNNDDCDDVNIENSSKGWIICMDSLGNRNVSVIEKKKQVLKILRFLNVEYYTNETYLKYIHSNDIVNKDSNRILKVLDNKLLSEWFVIYSPRNIPFQENSFDCGVYIIEYIHLLFHFGIRIFNVMASRSDHTSKHTGKNILIDSQWIHNRRNIYAKAIDFISKHINWIEDICLRNKLIDIFDDNVETHKVSDKKDTKHSFVRSPNLSRKKFSMHSLNRNYFMECRNKGDGD